MKRLFVPSDNDWKKEKPLWAVGFEVVYVDESESDKGIVWFDYQVGDVHASQWDNFSVCVDVKKLTVKGDGSRKFREYILDHVLYWYLRVKKEEQFYDLLI
ncbi:hypothetical protein [Bacillus sp. 1006-3]|uniref:hypothetical protein n=1 Tax=Bacillus sp. 1006-3 TaxID=2922309 RepID=UPI001F10E3A4|nr:hypothetical protein [Bacillus sp. 1006-3]MCH4866734.1 hypothetical protein [Bacillus sp. 1006-3]